MLSSDNISNIKKSIIQVNTLLLISISSLIIILYIIYQIILNSIKTVKLYNLKIAKKQQNSKVLYQNNITDDYTYTKNNEDLYIDNKNLNKEILKSINNSSQDQNKNLENMSRLKKRLKINDTLQSKIDYTVLANNNDELDYKKPTSFWSKVFFT